tara:strand:+ start:692 stop:1150 length:459 start_codon:yes stop_codon:yes gene_type:complete
MYHRGYFSKKQFNIKDNDFPVLTQSIIKQSKLSFKNLKNRNEKKENEIKEGWTKLYYINNKIIREYNPTKQKQEQKQKLIPTRAATLEEEFSKTILKMRERWEIYNMENDYQVDYDYYCDKNEYDSEPESQYDTDEHYDMNEDLIDNKHYDD